MVLLNTPWFGFVFLATFSPSQKKRYTNTVINMTKKTRASSDKSSMRTFTFGFPQRKFQHKHEHEITCVLACVCVCPLIQRFCLITTSVNWSCIIERGINTLHVSHPSNGAATLIAGACKNFGKKKKNKTKARS